MHSGEIGDKQFERRLTQTLRALAGLHSEAGDRRHLCF